MQDNKRRRISQDRRLLILLQANTKTKKDENSTNDFLSVLSQPST